MKCQYKILIVSMLIISSSCTKTLDVKPTSVITSSTFWKTESDAEGGLSGMYVYLRQQAALNLFIWGEARSGDLEWGQVSGTLDYDFFYNNTLNSANSGPDWLGLYTCINAANLIIKYVPGISFQSSDLKNNIIAQAYTMRAYIYYVLARTWGGVPLRLEPIEGYSAKTTQIPKASVEDVFNSIKQDLRKALQLYPDNTFPQGRNEWSKAATYALKADVYLWTGKLMNGGTADFDSSLAACNEVGKANVSLLPHFGDLFNYSNKGNKEVLMAVGFKALEPGDGNNFFDNMYSGPTPTTVDPVTGEIITMFQGGGVVWTITQAVINQFSMDDSRRDATFLILPQTPVTSPPLIVKGRGVLINGVRYYDSDYTLYRYADVLLLKAEAENALGMDPSTEINLIRQRAYGTNYNSHIFVSGSKEYNDQMILQERLLELAYEGKRWWDLVRFGKVFDLVPSLHNRASDKYLLLWPIPLTTLSLEPQVTQNPGW
jgi:starch-binding outer membrane protein, SusD/RagB family